ncbi:hypothetical protein D9619_010971 [Psilocybe cf. subviscida]|uniref:Uncharacterized protein n=1 Tax=Psilocybe cf. subviscida TaxID=2480587 RepID=A0A8H5B897_9AGAR|nr:hypothetical protein D9619_010971 [Psilocybe cf. subviscida]
MVKRDDECYVLRAQLGVYIPWRLTTLPQYNSPSFEYPTKPPPHPPMSTELQWKGYAIGDTNDWENFKLIDIKPKPKGDYDVDIKIEFCGKAPTI